MKVCPAALLAVMLIGGAFAAMVVGPFWGPPPSPLQARPMTARNAARCFGRSRFMGHPEVGDITTYPGVPGTAPTLTLS